MLASACGTILDPADLDVDPFGPTPESVRRLLQQDRVRRARAEAAELARRYPGIESEALYGLALWRNGETLEAEPRLRRGAEGGYPPARLAMARIRAAAGDREEARSLALAVFADHAEAGLDGRAHALLAGLEWHYGSPAAAGTRLRQWAEVEPDRRLAAVATAAADAVEGIGGDPPVGWVGGPARLELLPGSAPVAVRAEIAGRVAVLALRPSVTQSYLSPELVEAAGLQVHGNGRRGPAAGTPESRDGLEPVQLHYADTFAVVRDLALGDVRLPITVVAVWSPPEGMGIDGVLGADLLMRGAWMLDASGGSFAIAPPPERRPGPLAPPPGRVVAWAGVRPVIEGLSVQLMTVPRIGSRLLAAGLEPAGPSRLQPGPLFGSAAAGASGATMAGVRLGEHELVVSWERADLGGRARGGGVAPWAVLGRDSIAGLALHWDPVEQQFALVRPRPGG